MNSSSELLQRIQSDRNREIVLFLDFDGTLVELTPDPIDAHLTPDFHRVLEEIERIKWIHPIIISGRDYDFLKDRTSPLAFELSCEHGAELHVQGSTPLYPFGIKDTRWIDVGEGIMQKYVERIPRSKIERKSKSICWHYRMTEDRYHDQEPLLLEQELRAAIRSDDVQVYQGKKVVELKTAYANKGKFVDWYLQEFSKSGSLAIAIGDDVTDESMFEAVNRLGGLSVKVGPGQTAARFFLESRQSVLEFLRALARL